MKNKIVKIISIVLVLSALLLINVSQVLAHVTVKPAEVGVGERVNFAVSVPTEEDVPTIGLRLVIPDGLQSVRPNVKPGWSIELKKSGDGEDAKVTEIIWSSGSIPPEQRDEFIFSAQAPADEITLVWKAYQAYENGEVVAWETDPNKISEDTKHSGEEQEELKPYSETRVVNDLSSASQDKAGESGQMTTAISIMAVVLSGVAIFIAKADKK